VHLVGYLKRNKGNGSFANVVKFEYLGMTLTNQKSMHEEIKNKLYSGNACYHLVQNLLYSCLLSETTRIIILQYFACFLYACKTWTVTLIFKGQTGKLCPFKCIRVRGISLH
jgi:hypothetical protein